MKNNNFTKFLSTSLALALVATTFAPLTVKAEQSHWSASFMARSLEEGILSEDFAEKDPEEVVTFGDIAVSLRSIKGLSDQTYVTEGSENWDYLTESVEMIKLFCGVTDLTTESVVTRQQMAELCMKTFNPSMVEFWKNNQESLVEYVGKYEDHDEIDPDYYIYVYGIKMDSVMSGDTRNQFRPNAPLTIGELSVIATLCNQSYNYVYDESYIYDFYGCEEFYDFETFLYFRWIISTKSAMMDYKNPNEAISWNPKTGTVHSSIDDNSDFMQVLRWEIASYTDHFGVALSDWGKAQEVSYTFTDENVETLLYTTNQGFAYAESLPMDATGTVFTEDDGGLEKLLMSFIPSDLERYGSDGREIMDVNKANELLKLSRISIAISDVTPVGATVTWHTADTEGDSITVTGGYESFEQEFSYFMWDFTTAMTEWAKEEEITFVVSEDENKVPFLYTENESLAYRLGIPVSDDVTNIPKSDPRPTTNTGETMYEYYALIQDRDVLGELCGEVFGNLLETEDLITGDTFTWHTGESRISVNGSTEIKDIVEEKYGVNGSQIGKSVSKFFTEDITITVGEDFDGNQFPIVDNEMMSYVTGITMDEDKNTYVTDFPSGNPEDFWLKSLLAESAPDFLAVVYQTDLSAANELTKVVHITCAVMDAIPAGATVTWNTDWTEESGEPQILVTHEDPQVVEAMKKEIFLTIGEFNIGAATSQKYKDVPFVLHVDINEDGIPIFYCEEEIWANPLGLSLDRYL